MRFPGVAQLVARLIWDQEAAGSSPVTRINENVTFGIESGVFVYYISYYTFFAEAAQ